MKSATEMGINRLEYGSRLIDLKADVDEALAQLQEGELRREMSMAIEAYVDAYAAWGAETVLWVVEEEPAKSWAKKYPDIQTKVGDGVFVGKAKAIQVMWAAAGEHIDRASELISQ